MPMAQCVLHEPETQMRYMRILPFRWLTVDPDTIIRIGAERLAKFIEEAAKERRVLMAGCSDPDECDVLAQRVALNRTLLNGAWLRGGTGLDHAAFFYIVSCFEAAIRDHPDAPLIRNDPDPNRASQRGNRCILTPAQMLCMFLFHVWTGCAQDGLQGPFGVDQSTASRNIRWVRRILAGSNILPTDLVTMDEAAALSPEEIRKIVGNVLNLDWTHVQIEAPGDRESNDEAFSGKEHATTCKKLHGCTAQGLLILGGPWVGGRGSEIEYLREHLPNVGNLTDALVGPDTPASQRITVNFDGGPQGAQDVLKGANVRMPHRKPPGGELTPEQHDYNSRQAGERAIIENNFADLKHHGILGNRFRGSVHDLEETGAVAVGLVNLKRILRGAKGHVNDTHRKGLKPGPKKPGPQGRKPLKTFKNIKKKKEKK